MGTVGHVRHGGQPAPSKTGNLRTSRLQEDNMQTDWTKEDHRNTIVYHHFHYSWTTVSTAFSSTSLILCILLFLVVLLFALYSDWETKPFAPTCTEQNLTVYPPSLSSEIIHLYLATAITCWATILGCTESLTRSKGTAYYHRMNHYVWSLLRPLDHVKVLATASSRPPTPNQSVIGKALSKSRSNYHALSSHVSGGVSADP